MLSAADVPIFSKTMTTSEETTDETVTNSITLTITGLELEASELQGRASIEELEAILTDHLHERLDQPDSEVQSCVGHQFATVSPNCPDCNNSLDIQDIYLGRGTDAFAVARCAGDCGWVGDAIFKLVDLDERVADGYTSSVIDGTVTPDYRPYYCRES